MSYRIAAALAAIVAAIGFSAAPANAQVSDQDREYLEAAHQANLAEIAAGKLAQEKGTSQTVKELGAKFVEDHTKLDDSLRPVAQRLGVNLPTQPAADQRAVSALLHVVPAGREWDRIWVANQAGAHFESEENTQDEVDKGSDAAVKQLANEALPMIKSHADTVTRIAPDFGVTIQRN